MKQYVSDGSVFFNYKSQRNHSQPLGTQEQSGNRSFHFDLNTHKNTPPVFVNCNVTSLQQLLQMVSGSTTTSTSKLGRTAPLYLVGMTNLETFSRVRDSSDELRCQISPTVKISELSLLHVSPDALGKIHHISAEQIRLLSYNHSS